MAFTIPTTGAPAANTLPHVPVITKAKGVELLLNVVAPGTINAWVGKGQGAFNYYLSGTFVIAGAGRTSIIVPCPQNDLVGGMYFEATAGSNIQIEVVGYEYNNIP